MDNIVLPKPFIFKGDSKIYYAHFIRPGYGGLTCIDYSSHKDLNQFYTDPWIQQGLCGLTYIHLIEWIE